MSSKTLTSHRKMGHWCNISLFLALSMAILHSSQAHGPGNAPQDYVDAHSCIRRMLNLPPLTWDEKLASVAQAWADKRKDCKLVHSDRCGENMAMGPNLNGSYAVQMWLDERRNYDYNENKCIEKMCGHYTQTVWRDSTRIGCGRSQCDDGVCWVVVCNYDPPGNIVGQKPY